MAKKKKKTKVVPEAIKRHKGLMVGAVAFLLFAGCVYGMASKVPSVINPGRKVTRQELRAEVKAEVVRIRELTKARLAELDRQDKFKQDLVNLGLLVAEGGGLNPVGLVGFGLGAIGGGFAVDDGVKRYKNGKKKARS